jgi:hypothetical protein
MTSLGAKAVAADHSILRAELEILERMVDEISSRDGPGDARLLQAVESLIADKRARLDGEES